ncbi:hypothetical protein BK718_03770 [Bacillus thuringiensis serovar andalousiensis]|uniref:Uncharacterized protein n=2 Tax=Bacillus thuringiensis TaxID=1428 RepID=A0A9W4A823_BACTO|nr:MULTISPECIES: hypothetical protein [Bacillus cereus group]MDA2615356.1 hypothetical protein [Bacillus cereus]MEB8556063.1 hypothetical protein [Bacillus cereus]MEB8725560.1 hypothetical protein [Bacillus cereus]MEB8824235.1 hypothetical protein [Bacillus cereus]MEB8972765.1 hypothetical protein [Bacillus cereus]
MKKLFATFASFVCLDLSKISASVASTEASGEVNLDFILIEYREKGLMDTYRFSPTPWKNADGESFRTYWDGKYVWFSI